MGDLAGLKNTVGYSEEILFHEPMEALDSGSSALAFSFLRPGRDPTMCVKLLSTPPEGGWQGQNHPKKSNFGVEGDLRHEHDGRPRESASKSRLEMHKSGGVPAGGMGFRL